jgi:hypothetical protein
VIALATCAELPALADDEPMLIDALGAHGVDAAPVVWDDVSIDWGAYDLVVIRCTWDYQEQRDAFVRWALHVPRLFNPAEVVRWNTDKRYLSSLPHVIDTAFVRPGQGWEPPAGEYVIKPSVSAGSRDTARYRPGSVEAARARAHLGSLLDGGRTAMVQPYLGSVDEHGETGLVFFGGVYSHAIRKGQMLEAGQAPSDGIVLGEDVRAREPGARERAVAEDVLDALPWPRDELLYARVDLIADERGDPRLIELELTEPSLYFSCGDGAAERLASCVLARL